MCVFSNLSSSLRLIAPVESRLTSATEIRAHPLFAGRNWGMFNCFFNPNPYSNGHPKPSNSNFS